MKWQEYPYYFEGLEKQLERILQKKAELDKLRPHSNVRFKKYQRKYDYRMDL